MEKPISLHLTPGQILAANLTAALKVAGPQDEYGRPRRLKSTQLQRETGIARSTLRSLKNWTTTYEPNPDLRTLCRIADELRVPVAFLLMGPSQWQALMRAIEDMAQMLAAADKVEADSGLSGPYAAVQILRTLKVHPLTPPTSSGDQIDVRLRESLDRQNESCRRATLVAAALTQTGVRDNKSRKILTALAASLANQTTSNV